MDIQPILSLVVVILCFWRYRSGRAAIARTAPAQQRFLEKTGYRLRGIETQPLADQAREAVALYDEVPLQRPFVRSLGRDRLVYHRGSGFQVTRSGDQLGQFAWVLELATPSRVQWAIVRRHVPRGVERWPLGHPQIALPDEPLGLDHQAYADDAITVSRILATPALQSALLACTWLDLHVERDRIIFMDPRMKNLAAGSGGGLTLLLLGDDADKRFELLAMAHEQVASLLQLVATLSRDEVPRA